MLNFFLKKRFKKNNKKGFTLVELMVVVVIIGILTAIAIPVYNSVTANAERSACQANQRTIESAIVQYNASEKNNQAATINLRNADSDHYFSEFIKLPIVSKCTCGYEVEIDDKGVASFKYTDNSAKKDHKIGYEATAETTKD